jgi:hypothetical protein
VTRGKINPVSSDFEQKLREKFVKTIKMSIIVKQELISQGQR